jgi:predicted double-glycine peptidase
MRLRWLTASLVIAALPLTARAESVRLQTPAGAYTPQVTSWVDLPFKTVIRQQHDFSCGSAAVATLLTYHYGRPVGEAEVFEAMYAAGDQDRIRTRGFSLLDMQTYLAAQGLTADGYRLDLDRLEARGAPAITMISTNGYRHFVVVKGFRDGQVLVGDPAAGLRIYDRAEFAEAWSGVAFLIHDEGVEGRFNVNDEWETRGITDPGEVLPRRSLDTLTRELPPLYQISDVVVLNQ